VQPAIVGVERSTLPELDRPLLSLRFVSLS
jgi:hypothetical protein